MHVYKVGVFTKSQRDYRVLYFAQGPEMCGTPLLPHISNKPCLPLMEGKLESLHFKNCRCGWHKFQSFFEENESACK